MPVFDIGQIKKYRQNKGEKMNEYTVKYWTKNGSIVAIRVSAWSAMEAQAFAEALPNFNGIYCVDWD